MTAVFLLQKPLLSTGFAKGKEADELANRRTRQPWPAAQCKGHDGLPG